MSLHDTKMVIVMRDDLNMRKGKAIAQGSHAAMAFLTKRFRFSLENCGNLKTISIKDVEQKWLDNSFTKVCVKVNSEEELDSIHKHALEIGLEVNLIIDNGLTEFHGVPTKTCLAIGPDYSDKIDQVTKHLTLY
jgi:PTH2 family peptidyl-tRNA hydrolase